MTARKRAIKSILLYHHDNLDEELFVAFTDGERVSFGRWPAGDTTERNLVEKTVLKLWKLLAP